MSVLVSKSRLAKQGSEGLFVAKLGDVPWHHQIQSKNNDLRRQDSERTSGREWLVMAKLAGVNELRFHPQLVVGALFLGFEALVGDNNR